MTQNTPIYYFAFGSNMDENQMKKRIGKYKILGNGVLEGYCIVFNKPGLVGDSTGYANIAQKEGESVEGIIYELDEESIKKLDRHEGVPEHYIRKKIAVHFDGKLVECEVYIASKVQEGLKPSKEYLSRLLSGKFFLSENYFQILSKVETVD